MPPANGVPSADEGAKCSWIQLGRFHECRSPEIESYFWRNRASRGAAALRALSRLSGAPPPRPPEQVRNGVPPPRRLRRRTRRHSQTWPNFWWTALAGCARPCLCSAEPAREASCEHLALRCRFCVSNRPPPLGKPCGLAPRRGLERHESCNEMMHRRPLGRATNARARAVAIAG